MKIVLAALLSAALATGAYAQSPAASAGASPSAMAKSDARREMSNEKHIKDLHAKLKITAEQENLWSAVEKSMRDSADEIDQVVDKRSAAIGTATAVDDLNAYGDIAQAHADAVKKLSAAFSPLYAAMSDSQKKTADEVFTQRGHHMKSMHKATQ